MRFDLFRGLTELDAEQGGQERRATAASPGELRVAKAGVFRLGGTAVNGERDLLRAFGDPIQKCTARSS